MIEFNDLKQTWHRQEASENLDYSQEQLLMLLNNKIVSFKEQIRSRDRREILAAILVIIVFGVFFFVMPSIWQKVGSAIIVISGSYSWYKLKAVQRKAIKQEPDFDTTLPDHLKHELQWLEKQRKLLKIVAWWYILPIALGLILFAIGFERVIFKFVYIACVVLLGIGILMLNQNAVRKRFDPLIDKLREALSFMKHSE